ncbi:MAG: uL30 family ribosomal protein [Candidatus Aenigmarchaeota archaeon]|nr:uL30 family ribosomal protein [Candidatus Aenigmarchaeota archaeon]
MFAVVRIRGSTETYVTVEDTLRMLKLRKVNHCALVPDTPSYRGMLKKVENWVTWGEVSPELEQECRERGTPVRLHPPSRGHASIKLHFPKGALGYRGDKINDLLRRMA